MAGRKKELLKSTILLSGALAFAYNASTVLHELGHAIAYWTTGVMVKSIIVHPFNWSHMIPESVSNYPSFTSWGGFLFGSLMGLLLFTAVWRWRGPYVILALMTGVISFLHNGAYFIKREARLEFTVTGI